MVKKIVLHIAMFFMPLFFFGLQAVEEKMDLEILSLDRPTIVTAFEAITTDSSGKTLIFLSDGSQWLIRKGNVSEQWHKGDDIRIGSRQPVNYQGKYI